MISRPSPRNLMGNHVQFLKDRFRRRIKEFLFQALIGQILSTMLLFALTNNLKLSLILATVLSFLVFAIRIWRKREKYRHYGWH